MILIVVAVLIALVLFSVLKRVLPSLILVGAALYLYTKLFG